MKEHECRLCKYFGECGHTECRFDEETSEARRRAKVTGTEVEKLQAKLCVK
ncbi:MAG: hypothetical protein Q4F74_00185 [Synergistaceae bacterium]|nr:hypothetical protein [Synergistaceae bacterium]